MIVKNSTKGNILSYEIRYADTFLLRLLGLIPRTSLGDEEGLWLDPCSMIHMCFMRFSIDAVFLDRNLRVLKILHNFKPWRFSPWVPRSSSVLELPAGRAEKRGLKEGDVLDFVKKL